MIGSRHQIISSITTWAAVYMIWIILRLCFRVMRQRCSGWKKRCSVIERLHSHLARLSPILRLLGSSVVSVLSSLDCCNNTLTVLLAACEHRDSAGNLMMAEMTRLPCSSLVRVYEPLEEYRSACPCILVVCHGAHPHPIPQPLKTPPLIRLQIFKLLASLGQDLADLTPRRFLRHITVCAYLRECLPHIQLPSLSNLHVSLSNREHLRAYIDKARVKAFPEGTGWEGTFSFLSFRQSTHAIIHMYQVCYI
jgi:hypothetical protein